MKDRESLPPLSGAQTEIMNVVWEQGEVTLSQVCQALHSRRDLAKNTIQTQLTRLVEKGWLLHRVEGKAFCYRAAVEQDAAQSSVLQRMLDGVFGGSTEGLVMRLLDGRTLSKEEADRIREMIAQAEERED